MSQQSLESLLKTIKTLPEIKQRAISAIIGATVADAATRPLHWIYDQRKLTKIIGNNKTPEFWPKSESPFYTRPMGEHSGYNDIMLTMLKSLYTTNGRFDIQNLCETIKKHYGPNSVYYETYKLRTNWRRYVDPPIKGPWLQVAVVYFLERYSTESKGPYGDKNNDQNDAFCMNIPLIAQNADQTDLWNSTIKDVSSLLSTHNTSTKYYHLMTLLLSAYVQGFKDPVQHVKSEIKSIYPDVYQKLIELDRYKNSPYKETAAKFGIACYQPGTFIASYLAMEKTDSYVDAIRLNITAGGDNGSRSNIIGACFGAKYGIDGIPIAWMKKTNDIEQIMEMAISIISK